MSLEFEVFKYAKIDVQKLVNYGFERCGEGYHYVQNILNDAFRVEIVVDDDLEVSGKIFDTELEEEYTNFRISTMAMGYAGVVKDAYEKVLVDIREHCSSDEVFIYPQTNRIAQKIYEKYGDQPVFPWDDSPGCGVFKCPETMKWYGLIMNIDQKKLGEAESKEVEVMNVKLDPELILELVGKPGYYKCYHMSKIHWITILLDDTLDDEEIMDRLVMSHGFSEKKKKK